MNTSTMRAIVTTRFGGAELLEMKDSDLPEAHHGLEKGGVQNKSVVQKAGL